MDFAPWGSKSDARYPRGLSPWTGGYDMPAIPVDYPRGQGDTICLRGWGQVGQGW